MPIPIVDEARNKFSIDDTLRITFLIGKNLDGSIAYDVQKTIKYEVLQDNGTWNQIYEG